MQRLPKILEREPLVDAIFEVRFSEVPCLSEILPGALFSKLEIKPEISRLPAAEIPQPMRAADQNLRFQPVVTLGLEHFTVSIGDQAFSINCKLPYPKWAAFKNEIINITSLIRDIGISGRVQRYSLKYVNIIEAASIEDQIKKVNLDIHLGSFDVKDEAFSLMVQKPEKSTLHLISIISGARATLAGGRDLSGIVVDVDSIRHLSSMEYSSFVDSLAVEVEDLRVENKIKFFSCLTEDAITELGPVYE